MSNRNALVFVSQPSGRVNLAPARDYGEVCNVFPPDFQCWNEADTDAAYDMAHRALSQARAGDYFVFVGDPVLGLIAFDVFQSYVNGDCNVLKWDRRAGPDGGYRVVPIRPTL
jgi:hypothetical protein